MSYLKPRYKAIQLPLPSNSDPTDSKKVKETPFAGPFTSTLTPFPSPRRTFHVQPGKISQIRVHD
jgi:hypothetical protein